MRVMLAVLVVLLTATCGWSESGDYRTIEVGPGGNIKWSPDGKYLSYLSGADLRLYDVAGDSSFPVCPYHGLRYEWLNDSQVVFNRIHRPEKERAGHRGTELTWVSLGHRGKGSLVDSSVTLSLESKLNVNLGSDNAGTVFLYSADTIIMPIQIDSASLSAKPYGAVRAFSHSPMLRQGRRSVYADSDTWLVDIHGRKVKRVTRNRPLYLPLLSPSGVLVCSRDLGTGNTVILDTSGVEVADLGHAGGRYGWSAGSDTVVFATSIEDGHAILGGDVYLFFISTRKTVQLTFTPDVAEQAIRLSPCGRMLAFTAINKDPEGIAILVLEERDQ